MLNVFTIYETLFENLIIILHITFQKKLKFRNNRKCLYQLYISYLNITFWWNSLEFSNKMDLVSRTSVFDNVKHRHLICLNSGGRLFTFLTMLGLDSKDSMYSSNRKNVLLYCRLYMYCCRFRHLLSLS